MPAITMWRGWQFDQLRKSLQTVKSIIDSNPPETLSTYRDGGTGWTVLEVLCHLRDFEAVFLERAHLTVKQDFPDLPFPDPDTLAREKAYNKQNVQTVYEEWAGYRDEFMAFLENVADSDWECVANHPKRGDFTLNDQLFLTAHHDSNHIEQMTRILAEKRA